MRTFLRIGVTAVLLAATVSIVSAADPTVLGLSAAKLEGRSSLDFVVYERDGIKTGETIETVRTEEVAGLPVLDESGGRLVLVELRGERVWLRSDWLSLSDEPLPPCPKVRPGGADDQVVPGVAGVGPACRREEGH